MSLMPPPETHQYSFPALTDATALLAHLQQGRQLRRLAPQTLHARYLDTFDWRLHQAGLALLAQGDGEHWQLELVTPGGEISASDRATAPPRFARELADSALQARLAELCDCRILLTRLETRVSRQPLEVLNADRKIVVRLAVEAHHDTGEDSGPLPPGLRVWAVRGYRRELETVLEALHTLGAEPGPAMPLAAGLAARGIQPGDYDSKPRVDLNPGMRADHALRAVLRALLATVRANEAGTREDIDPEFLHDFRVAVRRTRAALGQCREIFPADSLGHFRGEFAWLGQITGATRDLDVYLLHFDQLKASLPGAMQADLEPLREILRQHQRKAQQTLAALLAGERYRRLLIDWDGFLATGAVDSHPALAAEPIVAVARERIWRAYRRVVRDGRALGPDSVDEDFHELRKRCKKLRYLMEFFQGLFPGGEIKTLIKALKGLQENLGEHQDQVVQADFLRQLAGELRADPGQLPTLLAMGALVADLTGQQQTSRGAFAARFGEFGSPEHRDSFRALFHPDGPGPRP